MQQGQSKRTFWLCGNNDNTELLLLFHGQAHTLHERLTDSVGHTRGSARDEKLILKIDEMLRCVDGIDIS